jgi:magnesium transporter
MHDERSSEVERHPERGLGVALSSGSAATVADAAQALEDGRAARAISRLTGGERTKLFTLLDSGYGADLIEELPEAQSGDILSRLPASSAAAIVDALPSDEQADLLGRLGPDRANRVLQAMRPDRAAGARQLLEYGRDTAGGLMVTEYLAYPESAAPDEVLRDIRQHATVYRRYDTQDLYVVSPDGRLRGAVQTRDLLFAEPGQRVGELASPEPLRLRVETPLDELERMFERHQLDSAPVIDAAAGTLVGIVRRQDVEQAAKESASRDLLKIAGILGGEELRTLPLTGRLTRRVVWLTINLLLDLVAVSVIAVYQNTIASVVALAVFLPIISDMGGNAGGQSTAVSIRELTMGLLRPSDVFRVIRAEVVLGLVAGVVVGALTAAAAYFWRGSAMLGAVVGIGLAVNLLVAACLGGIMPLLLRRLRLDPAVASGPILTTATDTVGFFVTLTLATVALPYLR